MTWYETVAIEADEGSVLHNMKSVDVAIVFVITQDMTFRRYVRCKVFFQKPYRYSAHCSQRRSSLVWHLLRIHIATITQLGSLHWHLISVPSC